MKTRTIILVLGLLGAGFTMAVGGIGLGGLHWANAGIAGTVVATRATQEATLGDMMHEGLRGDVFEALFHAQRGHAEGVAKAVKDAAEHGDEFISRVKALRALPLTAGQAEAAAQLAPLVDRYAAMGKQLSVQAGSDLPGALAGLPEFERLFETLAAVQDKMIEDIEAHATALQASTEQDRRLSSQVMWAVTLLATGVLVVMALGVTRSMTRHLGGEPRTVRALLHRVADGDLTLQVRLQAGDTASVMAGLAETVQRLRSTVRSVRDNAEAVTAAASEVHAGSDDLAQRTSQQAAALDAAVQALERISQQLTQSGEHAARASELAGQTSTVARQSGEAVQAVVSTMSEIQRASQRIADITSVIDGIAFQTNLLALNAAVEAARAGEQGRGFAVVAGEVRSLAGRSAQAAQEIKQLIGQSVETIEQGSGHVQAAGSAMAQLLGSVQQVSDLINDMAQASHAQGQDLSEVRDTVRQLDEVTQQNAALVEQSAAAAGALSGRAGQLSQAVHRFQVDPVT